MQIVVNVSKFLKCLEYSPIHYKCSTFAISEFCFKINGPIWNFEFQTQSKFSACRISRIEQIDYHCWSSWFVWNRIATVSLQVSLGIWVSWMTSASVSLQVSLGIWVSWMTSHQLNWICAILHIRILHVRVLWLSFDYHLSWIIFDTDARLICSAVELSQFCT